MKKVTIATHEGFDLDLYSWWPESKDVIAPVAGMPLFSFGDVSDSGRLLSLAYWNGPGCLLFTQPPLHEIKDGWSSFQGLTTKSPMVELTAEFAIRYLFVQGYDSILNMRNWTMRNDIFLDLCGCVRGYNDSKDKWDSVRQRSRDWLEDTIRRIDDCL